MMLSLYDYQLSRQAAAAYPFYALIAAAMRNADTDNIEKLRAAFPETHRLLTERYNNPAGMSDEELQK